ncbi:MAG: lipoate--protein ligase [Oscillospiraceae bacterium]|jgi:lipoate-protein ligase A
MKTYFYFSPYGDAYRNLAIDEHLLNTLKPGEAALLFYINHNAVIIGRNQNPWRECNLAALEEDGVQLVRRCSGGGAVYHDRGNLNYSFIAHRDRYDEKRQAGLILSALAEFGINAEATGRNDLTVNGYKFSGSAYCARGENRQHHGTLLINSNLSKMQRYLTVSAQKLRSKGISSVRSRVCNLTEFCSGLTAEGIVEKLKSAIGGEELAFTQEDFKEIELLKKRNESWEWRMGETPNFDYSFEKRFSWGTVELCLSVEGGTVSNAALYTDALDFELPSMVSSMLSGCRFTGKDLSNSLPKDDIILGELSRWLGEVIPA